MDIKEIWFKQILDFKENFTHLKFEDWLQNQKVNTKVFLSSDLYKHFELKFSNFFKMDCPFTISGLPEYEGESGIYFPEQGFLQFYEQNDEKPMTMFVEVYYDKKLIAKYSNQYYE